MITQQRIVDEYKSRLQELLERYPGGWWSGDFLFWAEYLVDYTYKMWHTQGYSDQAFEMTFGGGEEGELIYYLFRPTYQETRELEDYAPPVPRGYDG
jgi:hypothetical protein